MHTKWLPLRHRCKGSCRPATVLVHASTGREPEAQNPVDTMHPLVSSYINISPLLRFSPFSSPLKCMRCTPDSLGPSLTPKVM